MIKAVRRGSPVGVIWPQLLLLKATVTTTGPLLQASASLETEIVILQRR